MIREVNSNAFVKSFIVSTLPCVLYRLEGWFQTAGSTDFYVQIFDAATVPADNAVPLKSYLAQANFAFSQHIGEGLVCQTGCVVVLSSTEATKTIATAAGDNMDVRTDLEVSSSLAVPIPPAQLATAGDLTTTITNLTIWTSANNRIRKIIVNELSGAQTYLQFFTTGLATDGQVPWKQIPIPASVTNYELDFGQNGIPVYSSTTPPNTQTNNLHVYLCSNSGSKLAASLTNGNIKAEYITPLIN